MWNATRTFWILTWNLSKVRFYTLNFDRHTELSTEGKRLRYTEFIILLSIPKGSVDMEKSEMSLAFAFLTLLEHITSFKFFRHLVKWVLRE